MSALIEEFARFAELFPEPILLVSNVGNLCAANAAARSVLLADAAVNPEHCILEFVQDAPEQVIDYLRACSRSAQPLPGLLTFLKGRAAAGRFRSFGSAFRSRDAHQRPLVMLRLAPKDASTSRFVALNQQIDQLRTEIARRVTAEQQSRQLQCELVRQAEALKEADRRKDEFLAVLAHELRNPLVPLRNGLQIARLKISPDDTLNRAIEMMDRQLVHLIRLVDDLLDVNRVSRGVVELRRAPVFIMDVLARSVEAVRGDMEARSHDFRTELRAQNITVDGDADRLTQIFCNLLTNSAKYSHDGGLIRLSAVMEGSQVVVSVIDKGIGIPVEQLERVFEMFSQVRIHQGRSEGGLGIGLSLVRTLVEMHGGSVTARSEGVGSGSTFTVRLPVTDSLAKNEIATRMARPRASVPLRIVVADDNVDSANSLRLLLEVAGHEVHTAATGREALLQVAAVAPALVFMDVGMPELDGVEATRLIRERPGGNDLVIVALTGWGQPHDRQRTRLAGVDRHIVKPISPEEIAEILALASSNAARARGSQRCD